jgi:hypothetical protein
MLAAVSLLPRGGGVCALLLHADRKGCCGFWPSHKVERGTEEAAQGMAEVTPQAREGGWGQCGAEVCTQLLWGVWGAV